MGQSQHDSKIGNYGTRHRSWAHPLPECRKEEADRKDSGGVSYGAKNSQFLCSFGTFSRLHSTQISCLAEKDRPQLHFSQLVVFLRCAHGFSGIVCCPITTTYVLQNALRANSYTLFKSTKVWVLPPCKKILVGL